MTHLRTIYALLLLVSFLLFCTACVVEPSVQLDSAATPPTVAQEGNVLRGTKWQLVTLNNQAVLPEPLLTIEFADGQLLGHSGCNDYSSAYRVTETELIIQETMMTTMACVDEQRMTQEMQYMEALSQVTDFDLASGQLTLRNAQGNVLLVYAAT